MNSKVNNGVGRVPRDLPDLLTRSSLYQEFLREREEILRHKWIESEKAGHDLGFERALVSWVVHHRAQWRKTRRACSESPVCENYVSPGTYF